MKFLIDNVWLIGLALVSGGALLFPSLQRRGNKLTLLQATQLINQNKAVFLDVREPAAFAEGHVRDAKNIPAKELSTRIAELEKWKGKTVVVVCQTGVQSSSATSQLTKAGFAEAYSLEGGIAAWRAQGLPVTK